MVERVDRFLQRPAVDEGHGVKRSAFIVAQAVNRHDAGVLEPGGEGGLTQEPPP